MKIVASRQQTVRRNISTGEEMMSLIKKGFVVSEVDGEECVGMCEICSMPITKSQAYDADCEGITWHKSCALE